MTAMQHHGSEAAEDVRSFVMVFERIGSCDLGRVGGKNPSLGDERIVASAPCPVLAMPRESD